VVIQEIKKALFKSKPFLFPQELVVKVDSTRNVPVKLPKANGGWADKRDHQLCLNISQHDVTEKVSSTIPM
jgi:hypothetical protein